MGGISPVQQNKHQAGYHSHCAQIMKGAASNDLHNSAFRRNSSQSNLAHSQSNLLLQRVEIGAGVARCQSAETLSLLGNKLALVGECNSGKSRLLSLLQVALSGRLFEDPQQFLNFCDVRHASQLEENDERALTVHFEVAPALLKKLKLLFVCYTLSLRFDLESISATNAPSTIKNILEVVRNQSQEQDNSFAHLAVSYRLRQEANQLFLCITVFSDDLVWLHDKLPLQEETIATSSSPSTQEEPAAYTDFALRSKFLFDSLLVKMISMKANLSFRSGEKRVTKTEAKPRMHPQSTTPPSSPLVQKVEKPVRATSEEQIKPSTRVMKEEEQEHSTPAVPTVPDVRKVQPFSWNTLLDSPLAGIVSHLQPLQVADQGRSPFQSVFVSMLNHAATFMSYDTFRRTLPAEVDPGQTNIVAEENVGEILDDMMNSGSPSAAFQLQQIKEAIQMFLGHSLQVKISLARVLQRFFRARDMTVMPLPLKRILSGADFLLEPSMSDSTDSKSMNKKLWFLCQLLPDPEFAPTLVYDKFAAFLAEYEGQGALQKLEDLFKVPLVISSSSEIEITFVRGGTQPPIAWGDASSTFRHILLLLTAVHRKSGGSFILDQPECFLSPSVQQQISRHLLQQLSAKTMIVVTNSPSFLSTDCLRTAVRLCNDPTHGTTRLNRFQAGGSMTSQKMVVVDPQVRNLLFSQKVLLVDGMSNLRLVNGLHALLENEPDVIDTLENKLNRHGLSLDIKRLLNWTIVNTQAAAGLHPYVVAYGYRIPALMVSSRATAKVAGHSLSRDTAQNSAAFQYIQQVYGESKMMDLLQELFREVEGLRGTMQKLNLQKGQQLRSGEKSRLQTLEDQLRPELNAAEANLHVMINTELAKYSLFTWENGAGNMVAKTPRAAQKLYTAWENLVGAGQKEESRDYKRAQQWLCDMEEESQQGNQVWRFLPLPAISAAVRLLITEANEEFLRFCASLSRQPDLVSQPPHLLRPSIQSNAQS